jgi:hypothetical protein
MINEHRVVGGMRIGRGNRNMVLLATCFTLVFCLAYSSTFFPTRPLTFNRLHGVISQKIEFFETQIVEENLPQCHFVYYKTRITLLGNKPGSQRWEAGD